MIDELKKQYKEYSSYFEIKQRIGEGLIEEYLLSRINIIKQELLKSAGQGKSCYFYPLKEILNICEEYNVNWLFLTEIIEKNTILQSLGLNIVLYNDYIKFSGWAEEEIK